MDEELLVKVKLECIKIAAEALVPHTSSVNPEEITDYAKVLSDWIFDPRNAFDYKMHP